MASITLPILALVIYFFYHLFNYADITSGIRRWLVTSGLNDKVQYALKCSLCFSFYATLISWLFVYIPFYWVFAAPVINLALDNLLHPDK